MSAVDLLDSTNQKYDNVTSGLSAENVQTAIDELKASIVAGDGGGIGEFIDDSIAISSDDTALANDDGTANKNIGLGTSAGVNITTGYNNIGIGEFALEGDVTSKLTGYDNIGIGKNSGESLSTGFRNTFVGFSSGNRTLTGYNNTFIGDYAGNNNKTGSYNIGLGNNSLFGAPTYNGITGNNNIGIGNTSGYSVSTGTNNIMMGYYAGSYITTGTHNLALGENALYCGTYDLSGDYNLAIGASAGYAITTGSKNVLIGFNAGNALTTESSKLKIADNGTEALIDGDFVAKTLTINGVLTTTKVTGLDTPVDDTDATNKAFVVVKADKVVAPDITDGNLLSMDANGNLTNSAIADNNVVLQDSIQALHLTDALSISGSTISLNKGDGSTETVIAPNDIYTHPTHPGDDFSVDSGALTNATVISDIDINVTTDSSGHVTDANGAISTRTLTPANIGALSTTGTAADSSKLDGALPSDAAGNSTIVKRTSLGYIRANYFNTTASDTTTTPTHVYVETGSDGFIRPMTFHNFSDKLMAYGTNSNGEYFKFESGLLICQGSASVASSVSSSNKFGSTSGTLYYGLKTFTFPYSFYANPYVVMSSFHAATETKDVSTTTIATAIWSKTNSNSANTRYHAIGRWKS